MTRARRCPSCGATVELPPEQLAGTCAFCEAALVDADDAAEAVDHVVPFVVDRDRAARRLRGYLEGRWLAPEAVRRGARPENLHGVLVPFYVFDGTARSEWQARVGVQYTRTVVTTKGVKQVRDTEWFPLEGSHAAAYARQLVSGSRGLPEAEANALEPFDMGKALPFAPALTAGWIAERPSVDHGEAERIVARELAERENAAIRAGFLPGDEAADVRNTTATDIERVELALLPVWIATYRHGGDVFRLLVNGQTGETIGKVPNSLVKIGCLVLVGLAIVGAIALAAAIAQVLHGR